MARRSMAYFLWINDLRTFSSKVSFQTNNCYWNPLSRTLLEVSDNVMSPLNQRKISYREQWNLNKGVANWWKAKTKNWWSFQELNLLFSIPPRSVYSRYQMLLPQRPDSKSSNADSDSQYRNIRVWTISLKIECHKRMADPHHARAPMIAKQMVWSECLVFLLLPSGDCVGKMLVISWLHEIYIMIHKTFKVCYGI
jgi:hypothetical protein